MKVSIYLFITSVAQYQAINNFTAVEPTRNTPQAKFQGKFSSHSARAVGTLYIWKVCV